MTLLLYAIAGCDPRAVGGTGIGGAPLEAVSVGRLSAVVSEQREPDEPRSIERLWQYEAVIEALMERHPIVPVCYGSRVADRDEACALLRRRHDRLTAAVKRVDGAVELSVDARLRPPGELPASGREYMLARVEQHRRTAELRQRLEALSACARALRTDELRPPALGVHGAYLVERAATQAFTQRVSELADALVDVDVVCTGPWPPYTFAEEPRP